MTIMIAKIMQKTFQMLNTIDVFKPFSQLRDFTHLPRNYA